MIGRPVPWATKPSTVRIRSDAPTPQFAPKASGGLGSFSTISAIAAEVMPIMVRPAVSKLIVPHHGMPASRPLRHRVDDVHRFATIDRRIARIESFVKHSGVI